MMKRHFLLLIFLVAASFLVRAQEDGFDEGEMADPYLPREDPYGDMDSYGGQHDGYGDPYGGGAPPPADVKQFSSWTELESFIKEDEMEPAVIGYFDESNEEDLAAFKEIAQREEQNYRFAFTTDKETLETKKYDHCAVIVYPPSKFINEKQGERSKYRFPGKSIANSQSFLEFVRTKSLPLVGEYSLSSRGRYDAVVEGSHRELVTVFTNVDHQRNSKGFNYIANRLRKVAKEFSASKSNSLVFSIASIKDFQADMESDYLFEEVDPKKSYAGVKDDKNFFYRMTAGDFSFDRLAQFVRDFQSGLVEGHEGKGKSGHGHGGDEEGEAMYSTDSAVTQLTAENFKEEVDESAKDVLLEFYAPWCGHCKHLKPEYERVAAHFRGDSGVTIAAMDATAHEPPKGYEVQGYPTVLFLPADSKKAVSYDDERDADSIIAWINAHRTTAKEEL